MKHGIWMATVCIAGLACAQAQDVTEERAAYALLATFVGEFDHQGTEDLPASGTIKFGLFEGGKFITWDETYAPESGEPNSLHGMLGYDEQQKHYTWFRIFNNGAYDVAEGWYEDGTLTFVMTTVNWEPFGNDAWTEPGALFRTKWTDISPDGFTYLWEKSVRGGPWEQAERGDLTRTR